MRFEFVVQGDLPPKKDGASSMWSKQSEFARLVALRRASLCANPKPEVLRSRIHLLLEVHLLEPEARDSGDLDNFVSGVCDGLMKAASGLPDVNDWSDPSLANVHPRHEIAIHDDAAVVEIVARKFAETGGPPWYRVVLEGEL
jgi:hypothetical protein